MSPAPAPRLTPTPANAWALWPLGDRAAWLLAVLVAMGFWVLALSAARQNGATYDEPAFIAAGYTHWAFNDHRMTAQNGPLPHLVEGFPVWLMKPKFVEQDSAIWQKSAAFQAGRNILYFNGNNGEAILMLARAANALFGVGLVLVIFAWARHLWGNAAGLLAATLAALSPTLLAHNGVATSDSALVFFLYLGMYCFWRSLRACTVWTVLGVMIAITGALTSKLTGVMLLVYLTGILLVELIAHRSSTLQIRRKYYTLRSRMKRMALGITLIAVGLVAAWGAVWAMHGFRYTAFTPGMDKDAEFLRPWKEVIPKGIVLGGAVTVIKDNKLLPEGYLWGLCFIYSTLGKRSAWLHGEYSDTGWREFFPIAYGIKSTAFELVLTVGFLCLLIYAGVQSIRRRTLTSTAPPLALTALAPLVLIAVLYWTLSINSNINIGQRHLLPVYPLIFICAGYLVASMRESRRVLVVLVVMLLMGQAIETVRAFPHYIGYFNPLVGGSYQGWKWLVDSSLDWGQDLPAVQKWVADNPIRPGETRYIAYFGTDDLNKVADGQFKLLQVVPRQYYGPAESQLQPGTYIISATMLSCVYMDGFPGKWAGENATRFAKLKKTLEEYIKVNQLKPNTYRIEQDIIEHYKRGRFAKLCDYLRRRGPDSQITPALLVFNLSASELNEALRP
ncbi:MAG: phospholipid carrier-dependent glycosyltransferase [Verrucomicrobiota bacterium]|nr:phospholipid carrier-dependent glycosyltransferase [Verrucomicrobiota bacterium]